MSDYFSFSRRNKYSSWINPRTTSNLWSKLPEKTDTAYPLAHWKFKTYFGNDIMLVSNAWTRTELLNRIEGTYTPPSPVTNSPPLKLCLGDRVRLIKHLNFLMPSRNKWLTWLFFWFRRFIVSLSVVGGGKENASKPGKKRKMLSDTCWPGCPADAESGSLKTCIEEKNNTLVTTNNKKKNS